MKSARLMTIIVMWHAFHRAWPSPSLDAVLMPRCVESTIVWSGLEFDDTEPGLSRSTSQVLLVCLGDD